MVDAKLIRAMLAFHFFIHLDEAVAKSEALKTLAVLRRRLGHGHWTELEKLKILLEILIHSCRGHQHRVQQGQPILFNEDQWRLPPKATLGPWLELRKSATPDEFLALLLVKALSLDSEVVAEQLGVTVGTLNYRLSRGMKKLGGFVMAAGSP